MSRDAASRPHPTASVVVMLAAGVAGVASGALGLVGLAVMAAGAALSVGRARGWRPALAAARPLLATLLATAYLPLFVIDLVRAADDDPVLPLARLVALLAFAEGFAGTRRTPFRPLLLSLLLVIVAAAETTDAWFALALLVVSVASVVALAGITVARDAEATGPAVPRMSIPRATGLAIASLVVGGLLFLLVPHAGAGWGRRPLLGERETERATGLSDEVRLGAIGAVKKRRTIALRARVISGALDDETTYWRAQVFETWTGSGWRAEEPGTAGASAPLRLRAGRRVPLDRAEPAGRIVAELEVRLERAGLDEIVLPGDAAWIEPAERSTIVVDDEGRPRSYLGAGPRRYALGLDETGPTARPGPVLSRPTAAAAASVEPGVAAWAAGVAPGERDPLRIARAFVADLSARPYSLDTTAIDPARPLASFLDGAPAHCEYFASAMALGLRERGVAARAVGGYLGADRLPFGRELIVRDDRAHLWVEALIPGRGWTRFDPTPPAGRRPASGLLATVRGAYDWSVVAWDSWIVGLDIGDQQNLALGAADALARVARRLAAAARGAGPAVVAALIAALAFATALAVRRARRRGARPAIPAEYRRFLALAARRGAVPGASETAAEFSRRAGSALGVTGDAEIVTRYYERCRFSVVPPTAAEADGARQAVRRLRAAVR